MSNVQDIKQFANQTTMVLGGKTRVLQFDMNAFAELEERFGSVEAAMEQLSGGKMKDIRLILWTALIHEEAVIDEETGEPIKYNITPFQVGSWIKNGKMLTQASEKISEAMTNGMPEMDLEDPELQAKLKEQGFKVVDGVVVRDDEDEEKNV